MAKALKKAEKAKEMDMLPVMSLMTVLIPVLLTMTAFQKLAIVDINMPERSDVPPTESEPPPPDDNALNLTIAISKDAVAGDYLTIWARGGNLPSVYYKEMWTFRCKSDGDTITYDPSIISSNSPPKCQDGTVLDAEKYKYSIETIHLWTLRKESEEDPGKVLMSVYSKSDSAYVDGNNEFITDPKQIVPGASAATIAESSMRKFACGQTAAGVEDICSDGKIAVTFKPRSAYDELAQVLVALHNKFIDSPDADNIIITANADTAFDKLISVMDRARDAGFYKIQLAVLEGG